MASNYDQLAKSYRNTQIDIMKVILEFLVYLGFPIILEIKFSVFCMYSYLTRGTEKKYQSFKDDCADLMEEHLIYFIV